MINEKKTILEKEIKKNEEDANNQLKKIELIKSLEAQLKESEEKIIDKNNQSEKEITQILNRLNKELEKQKKYSLEKILIDFLPISDSIERASDLIEQNKSDEIFLEIKKQLKSISNILKEFFVFFNVRKINDINISFDPAVHQAMSIDYTNKIEPNKIVMIMQPGYILYESRLLRPAMVVVSKKKI